MPLPDERPRQSVANLIGRFEQQTKRQSINGSPLRTSTSLSNIAGEAAEEPKAKREWPPKSVKKDTEAAPSPPVTSEVAPKPSLPTPDASPKVEKVDLPPPTEPVPEPTPEPDQPVKAEEPPAAAAIPSEPTPEAGVAEMPAPEAEPIVGTTIPATARAPATPSKKTTASRPATTPKAARTPTKAIPLSLQSLSSTSTSKPTQTKPRPLSSMSTTRTPTTPGRSRTPSVRPKTPLITPRPKTPASGLFAPTAASLARSRHAPDPAPAPARKQTLDTTVADRLSKPTAASLSRARVPATNAAPSRGTTPRRGAAPARGTAPTKGVTTVKPKTGPTNTKAKEKLGAKDAVVAGAGTATVVDVAVDHAEDQDADAVPAISGDEILAQESGADEEEGALHEPATDVSSHATDDADIHQEPSGISQDEAANTSAEEDTVESTEESVEPHTEEEEHEQPPSPSPVPTKSGGDIEDLVSMLEVKKPTMLSSLDDHDLAGEIPDEE